MPPSQDNQRLIHDLETRQDPEAKQPKILYAGDQYDGQPYVVVTEEDIAIVGDKRSVIAVNPDFGILLGGRVSLSCMPDELMFGGGYWRLDPRHLSTVPSTTPTPIPLLVKSIPPLLNARSDISKSLDFMNSIAGISK
jgi:hypothetical protein